MHSPGPVTHVGADTCVDKYVEGSTLPSDCYQISTYLWKEVRKEGREGERKKGRERKNEPRQKLESQYHPQGYQLESHSRCKITENPVLYHTSIYIFYFKKPG